MNKRGLQLFIFFLLFSAFSLVFAQSNIHINIDSVENNRFPEVEAYLTVSDQSGFPIEGLTIDNFSVSEDGQLVPSFEVTPIDGTNPLIIVLVIDTSETMGYQPEPTRMEQVIAAGKEVVATLAPQDLVAVVSFSDQVTIVQNLTADKNLVDNALDSLEPEGNAALNDALIEAIGLVSNRSERRAVILLTDGVESGISQYTFDEVIDEAVRWAVPIYPIGLWSASEEQLGKLAEQTGGTSQVEQEPEDLLQMLEKVSAELSALRQQYQLRFTSNLPADGSEHELAITVDFNNWHAEQSRRFIAPPGDVTISFLDFQDGQVVGGNILFAPEVFSPATLNRLDILIDGQPLTSVLSPPFEYSWDSTTVTPGEYEFLFVAEDSAGNTGQATIKLNVRPPVIVEISSPGNGQKIVGPGSTQISAQVDSLSRIARVEFHINDQVLETLEDEPFEVSWNLRGVEAGRHVIRVSATDVNGFSGEAQIDVLVEGAATEGSGGTLWIAAIAVALALAVIVVTLGLRSRKRAKVQTGATPMASASAQTILRELEGLHPNQTWSLAAGEVRLGRKRDENDIHLKGRSASRRHAVIRMQNGAHVLQNLRPENPVLVNGSPAGGQYILQPGDVIQIGESLFRYEKQA